MKVKEEPPRRISRNLQSQGRSKLAPEGSNSEVPTKEFCASKVWNSNLVLKFWVRGRVLQDLKRRLSLCMDHFCSETTKCKSGRHCYNFKNRFKTQLIYANKILSTNALSVFILHPHQNGICNNNLRLIQNIIRASKLAAKNTKRFVMTSLILPHSPRVPI